MKKHLITIALVASVLVPTASYAELQAPAVTCPSNDPAVSCPTTLPTTSVCNSFTRNLTVGYRNLKDDRQVTLLQDLLRDYGYFKTESTGYFGNITLQAVKDYQRANGVPPTGFVGVLTRAKLNTCNPVPTTSSNLNVTSPRAGVTWSLGSTQQITWTDSNKYIAAEKYDITLAPYMNCGIGKPCNKMAIKPYTIATDTYLNTDGYAWNVGATSEADRTIPAGQYMINVCTTDSTNCAQSGVFSISAATTASNLKVTAPKGGELWNRGTTQTISWTDSNTYIMAPKYDVKVQLDLDCKPNQPCIALFPLPATIAKNVSNTTYSWNVGSVLEADRTLGDGKYRIFVCPAGNTNIEDLTGCEKSASYVTIITLPTTATTTTIAQLSTTSAPIGTTVRILGNNLNNVKNINFGNGYVPKDAITVGPIGFTGVSYLEFKVPNQIAPACYYAKPLHCMIAAMITTPGNYDVSVTNTDNTTSNKLPFTVTAK